MINNTLSLSLKILGVMAIAVVSMYLTYENMDALPALIGVLLCVVGMAWSVMSEVRKITA
jgi:hypothetical protein